MSYKKPSVSVRQVQVTESLPLPDPTYKSVVVGTGYHWQNPFREDAEMNSVAAADYEGAELTVDISDFTSYTTIVPDTLIVDLVRKSGPSGTIGEVIPLVKDTDFTFAAGVITLNLGITGFDTADDKAKVRVGFLSERTDLNNEFQTITSGQDIRDFIGDPVPWNPAAFGAQLAMANSGMSTNVMGVPAAGDFTDAVTGLENRDVYAIAALTSASAEAEKFSAHVTAMALPENKKERVAFASRSVAEYSDTTYFANDATNTEKGETAQALQNYSAAIGNRRYFQIHPDAGWVEEEVHVSTLRDSFIAGVFGAGFTLKPKLISNTSLQGTRYKAQENITDTIIDAFIAEGITRVRVYYPVPGYYFTAAIAGQAVSKTPPAPLTNRGISGFAMIHRSNEYFSPSQMETIAEGGTWVLEQRGIGTIVTSHQLSTDAVTIETRELSITTQLDNVANFFRDLVSPLIGTRVISDSFIRQLRASMVGGAETLVELREIRDVQIVNLYQDDLQPDTIKADIMVLPLYPLNYIKITLEF